MDKNNKEKIIFSLQQIEKNGGKVSELPKMKCLHVVKGATYLKFETNLFFLKNSNQGCKCLLNIRENNPLAILPRGNIYSK